MQKSRVFIGTTVILIALLAVSFYLLGRSAKEETTDATINRRKAQKFCREAIRLDSLYKTYAAVSVSLDPVLLAGTKANLKRQLAGMKAEFARTGTPPAQLASKLIRNYEFRLLLVEEIRRKQQLQGEEVNRLTQRIREQETVNQELKTKNQMVEQALLNLP